MSLVKKILVANRGEIACRIIRTAKRMGVQTVAIYSDIDKHSKFVDIADQAFHVGPNPSCTYCPTQPKIAVDSKCEALHPGFGFLSENANFANECVDNKVIFVGPPLSAMVSMGSKSESKKIMTAAKVPVVPGYHLENQDSELLAAEAEKIGYPVLIKAVLGGGGKGMRIVTNKADFKQALGSCQRQALKSFRDDRVIIEKYITKPRHIEVQIFGDQMGNYVHLYQRDCSIQRRHQKVIQEAPSNIGDQIRKSIYASAINAAKAVGYYNAGTVEFIFDLDSNQHYFMEMNTRLQVEHPISEMITGYDFVEWQLLVASGFPLPRKQEDIKKKGHSIQARVYSEDPFNNFFPNHGTLSFFREPTERPGVRIETGVREKDKISIFYDPMIAKLVTYGSNRSQAIDLMRAALNEYRVVGVKTNLKFLKRVINDSSFHSEDYDTSYIEQNKAQLLKKQSAVDHYKLISAAIAHYHNSIKESVIPQDLLGFRNIPGLKQTHLIKAKESFIQSELSYSVQMGQFARDKGDATIDGRKYGYSFLEKDSNKLTVTINNEVRNIEYFVQGNTVHLFDEVGDSIAFHFESDYIGKPRVSGQQLLTIKAPISGLLTKICCQKGEVLKKNQSIVIMELMKMELVVKAPFDCKISKILVEKGAFVEDDKPMVELINL